MLNLYLVIVKSYLGIGVIVARIIVEGKRFTVAAEFALPTKPDLTLGGGMIKFKADGQSLEVVQ